MRPASAKPMIGLRLLVLSGVIVSLAACEPQRPQSGHGYYTRPGVEYNSYGVERYDHDQNFRDDNVYEGRGARKNRHDDEHHEYRDDDDLHETNRGDGVTRDDFGHCAPGLGKQGRC